MLASILMFEHLLCISNTGTTAPLMPSILSTCLPHKVQQRNPTWFFTILVSAKSFQGKNWKVRVGHCNDTLVISRPNKTHDDLDPPFSRFSPASHSPRTSPIGSTLTRFPIRARLCLKSRTERWKSSSNTISNTTKSRIWAKSLSSLQKEMNSNTNFRWAPQTTSHMGRLNHSNRLQPSVVMYNQEGIQNISKPQAEWLDLTRWSHSWLPNGVLLNKRASKKIKAMNEMKHVQTAILPPVALWDLCSLHSKVDLVFKLQMPWKNPPRAVTRDRVWTKPSFLLRYFSILSNITKNPISD